MTVTEIPASLKSSLTTLAEHSLGKYYLIINAYFANTNKFNHKPESAKIDIFDFHHYNE